MIFTHWRQSWLIDKYLADGMSEKEKQVFENHLDGCPDCREKLEQELEFYKELSDAGKSLDPAMERLRSQILNYPPITQLQRSKTGTESVEEISPYHGYFHGWNLKIAVAVLAIIILNVAVWMSHLGPSLTPIEITKVLGTGIWVQEPGTTGWIPLDTKHSPVYLKPATKIRTDEYTKFQLKLGNTAQIWVDRSAKLTLRQTTDTAFDLTQGLAFASVTHFHRKFQVGTPAGLVQVYGTEFFLDVDTTKHTKITCVQDTVYFDGTAHKYAIPQGFQVQAIPYKEVSAPVPINLDPILNWKNQMQEFMRSSPETLNRLRSEYITRGNDAFHRKDFQDALENYRTAASLDPSYYSSYYGAGRTLFTMGNYAAATAAYNRAIALKPSYTVSSYQLAETMLELKQYPQAEHILQKLINQKPADHANYVILGETYLMQGQLDRAKNAFQNAIQYGADTCPNCNPRLHGGLADIARQKKNFSSAEEEFNKIMNNVPIPAIVYAEKALLYIDENKVSLASQAWKEYLLLDPNGPYAVIARSQTSKQID